MFVRAAEERWVSSVPASVMKSVPDDFACREPVRFSDLEQNRDSGGPCADLVSPCGSSREVVAR